MRGRIFRPLILVLVTALLVPGGAQSRLAQPQLADPPAAAPNRAQATKALHRSPVMFIENVGQFAEGARFQVRSGTGTMWLAEDAIWVTVLEQGSMGAEEQGSKDAEERSLPHPRTSAFQPRKGVNLKLTFPGANPRPRLEPFNRLETHVSYFTVNDPAQWHADVPVWGAVRYVDLYPGVDLEVTSEGGRWAWRFAIRNSPFTIPNVRLRVEGADALALDGDRLRLATTVGDFTLPLLQTVASDGSSLALPSGLPAVDGTDITAPFSSAPPLLRSPALFPLVPLSPQDNPSGLLYSTFLGGSYKDWSMGIAVDGSGAAYITGLTLSSSFPTTPGAFDTYYSGYGDAFVAKVSSTGTNLIYTTFLGGSNGDLGYSIAVDGSGAAYVAGGTSSYNFPTTSGAFDRSYNGGGDTFVMKLNATGSALIYSTFLGGNDEDSWAPFIAVDGSGAAYVTGRTFSSNFPTTSGAFDRTFDGGMYDAFVVKLNVTGSTLAYATFLGGSAEEWGFDIAVDGSGAVYVTGDTNSYNFPTTAGSLDRSYNGGKDAFVVKLSDTGASLVYATFLGGSSYERGYSIAVDGSGAAYISGSTWSFNFPITSGAFDTSYNGYGDAFVAKLNAGGNVLIYATFLGGTQRDCSVSIDVDSSGHAYVVGITKSENFPTAPGAFDITHNGSRDVFIAKLDSSASTLQYATFLGGSQDDGGWDESGYFYYALGIAVDSSGAAYVTGITLSTDFPTTVGAFDTTYNSGGDAFVAKLAFGIVHEARLDIGMPYPDCSWDAQPRPCWRGCPSDYIGCGGSYHGFYLGVCTDLAMDAYNAGVPFNLQNALYQDHRAHSGRYRWGSARNAEDMRRYFVYNQQLLPHSQAYQPGDIAFFDWPKDGLGSSNHVGVISEVDANDRPLRMVHASGVCLVNPSGLAFEEAWSSYYDRHIQGHGRLSGTESSAMAADETLPVLRITVDSPSVALRLLDANGKSTSRSYVESLVALNNEAAIPYIPGGTYADLGTEQVITVTQPLSNTSQYFVELTGQAAVTYSLHIETWQDSSVTNSEVFTQAITPGETQGSQITLSAPGGTINFTATSPAPSPTTGITDAVELSGLAGTSAQATFSVAEVGGHQSLQNVTVSATDLMDQLGGVVSGTQLIVTPDSFTVAAGSSQEVNVQIGLTDVAPGVYQGGLVLGSDSGCARRMRLTLEVRFHNLYLPIILKNY